MLTTFKEYFNKIKEAEGDFGDEAQADSVKQTVMNTSDEKVKNKFEDARGFIEPSGKIKEIGDTPHVDYAKFVSQEIMVDGKPVRKKFKNLKDMCMNTGLIRWSPETSAFSVFKAMTPEQIKTIKDILEAYGYVKLMMEYLNKQTGAIEYVDFDDGDANKADSKLARVQHRVS
jgi:hypothetical protein